MLPIVNPTHKQPALRRLLNIVLRRTDKVPLTTSAALGLLIAASGVQLPAFDTARAERYAAPWGTAQAYSRLGPRVPVQPDDVVKDGVVIGRDPDPFIRGEMLRHYGVGGP